MRSTYNHIAVMITAVKKKARSERKTYLKIVLQGVTVSPSVTLLFAVTVSPTGQEELIFAA